MNVTLTNHVGVKNCFEAFSLKRVLSKAISALNQAGAWPKHNDGIRIRIVDSGDRQENGADFPSMRSESTTEDFPVGGVVKRASGTPMEITVQSNLFAFGLGQQLVKGGASKKQVATFMLAHEIFHLTEPERQELAGVQDAHRHSSLAGASMEDFPNEWKKVMDDLFAKFPVDHGSPANFVKAGLIANEAAADLVGLHWLHQAGAGGFNKFEDILIDARRSAERSGSGYAIADALESALSSGSPSPDEARKTCWMLALDQLINQPGLDKAVRDRLKALPELTGGMRAESKVKLDQLSP